jgi:hypothetical protein
VGGNLGYCNALSRLERAWIRYRCTAGFERFFIEIDEDLKEPKVIL